MAKANKQYTLIPIKPTLPQALPISQNLAFIYMLQILQKRRKSTSLESTLSLWIAARIFNPLAMTDSRIKARFGSNDSKGCGVALFVLVKFSKETALRLFWGRSYLSGNDCPKILAIK